MTLSSPHRPKAVAAVIGGGPAGLMAAERLAAAGLRVGPGPSPDATALAARLKALPVRLIAAQPLEGAISTAGGLAWSELDGGFMLERLPGVFAAGEMLDWEAPTGGYLLQACFATGHAAAEGALAWLRRASPP